MVRAAMVALAGMVGRRSRLVHYRGLVVTAAPVQTRRQVLQAMAEQVAPAAEVCRVRRERSLRQPLQAVPDRPVAMVVPEVWQRWVPLVTVVPVALAVPAATEVMVSMEWARALRLAALAVMVVPVVLVAPQRRAPLVTVVPAAWLVLAATVVLAASLVPVARAVLEETVAPAELVRTLRLELTGSAVQVDLRVLAAWPEMAALETF